MSIPMIIGMATGVAPMPEPIPKALVTLVFGAGLPAPFLMALSAGSHLGYGGVVQQRLYLTAQFFEKMPTDWLIGEEVRPEPLNDDVLGRALDDLYDSGVTELFRDLAAHAAEKLGLTSRRAI